jgi:hypothetical protein
VGAREELLAAARSLADKGLTTFSPAQLIAEVRVLGSAYRDTTLRTFINGPMCINSPDHHAVKYPDFERVARGQYRLAGSGTSSIAPRLPTQEPAPDPPDGAEAPRAHDAEWFWEGNVQAAVVSHLAATGWSIRRVASTSTSEHGVDIEADKNGERLLVEVKGYPGSTYARGERKGTAKSAPAATQARTYFSNAVLAGLLMRAEHDDARVVLAFPDMPTFTSLGGRVVTPLGSAGVEVWTVRSDGGIERLFQR